MANVQKTIPSKIIKDVPVSDNVKAETSKQNSKKAQKERKLNTAKDVMSWFGLSIVDIKDKQYLSEIGLTDREIELLELEFDSKLQTNLDHLSSAELDPSIKSIMLKYGINLTILKDKKALGDLSIPKKDMLQIQEFITKLLS